MGLIREERTTSLELELHEAKMESFELRKKLRRMQGEGSFSELFALYEDEIAALQAALTERRKETSELEAACRDAMLQREAQSREADERAREPSRDHEGERRGQGSVEQLRVGHCTQHNTRARVDTGAAVQLGAGADDRRSAHREKDLEEAVLHM